ncbi:MAG: T9SS type A sorting domain-containing protein, partial [Marinirhabdus sp.]
TFFLADQACYAQEYFQTTTFGNTSVENPINYATDSNGNVYTVGLYSGTITVGSTSITWEGGNADGFLTKHDTNGVPVWVKGFGGFMDDVAVDVAIDTNDNIYLTGYFVGQGPNSFDADPGPGEFLLEQLSPIASRDCFIIKLDSNGDFVWAKQVSNPAGAGANEDSRAIAVDGNGNVYVAGSYVYADFDPSPTGAVELFSTGGGASPDGFLLKLDNAGNFISVNTFDGVGLIQVEAMEFDDNEDILLSGRFANMVDLDPGAGTDEHTSNGGNDIFMAKVTNNASYIWGQAFGSAGLEINTFIKVLTSGIYLGGLVSNGADLDPGAGSSTVTTNGDYDGFLSRFNLDGTYVNSYVVGGEGNVNIETINDVTEGASGSIFAVGSFIGTTDFDPSASEALTTSNGNSDNFLVELTPGLTYQNHYTIGGNDEESLPQLVFNSNNEVLTFGAFRSTNIDFNPFKGEDIQSSNGFSDVYFSRYSLEETAGVEDNLWNEVYVFPNPAANTVHIAGGDTIVTSYQLYSVLGSPVKSGAATTAIDVSQLPRGTYLLKLNGKTGTVTKKITKL